MKEFILLGSALAFDTLATAFDVSKTEEGIAKGVAVEANELVDKLAGTNKPSSLFLYAWNFGFIAVVFGIAAYMNTLSENLAYAGIGGGTAALIADGLKHIKGGLAWRYLLAGGYIDPLGEEHSITEKLFGIWHWSLPKKK